MEGLDANKWYKVKIFNKEVNWASVVASGILFVGLELWRRKYIAKKIKSDISLAMQNIKEDTETNSENIIDRVENWLDENLG